MRQAGGPCPPPPLPPQFTKITLSLPLICRRIQSKTKWMPPSKFRKASMSKARLFSFEPSSEKPETYHWVSSLFH